MDDLQRLEDWVTPLLAKLSAPEQRALARTVARELRAGNVEHMRAQQAPDGTGWEPRKASGLRNGRGATSVASFSMRARPGAPVSMPLRWEELGKVASGDAFDIRNTPARLKRLKSHPWAGIDRVRQSLPV